MATSVQDLRVQLTRETSGFRNGQKSGCTYFLEDVEGRYPEFVLHDRKDQFLLVTGVCYKLTGVYRYSNTEEYGKQNILKTQSVKVQR